MVQYLEIWNEGRADKLEEMENRTTKMMQTYSVGVYPYAET
jgi:hypothetical protein